MYPQLLHAHNGLRWLILLVLIIAVARAFWGWSGKRDWQKSDKLSGLFLVIFMDLQILTGIILYAFVSPITKAAFNDFAAAMQNPTLRFYAVEHISVMTIALVLVHLGRIKSKKNNLPWKKHRTAAIYYLIALFLISAAIPWKTLM